MKRPVISTLLALLLFSIGNSIIYSNEISAEELERWFNSDSLEPPRYERTANVNEGDLVFLTQAPDKKIHHHHSLNDGWILINQCHRNIDKVSAAQILFKAGKVKNIKVVLSENIEKAWVEGASVQMENIKADAVLCVQANTRSLKQLKDGTYSLRNGPFMRRFLDGYFPLHVSLDLNYTQTNLELIDIQPVTQSGFEVKKMDGIVKIDTFFEGRLLTEFHFKQKSL